MFHVSSMLGDTLHRRVKDNNGMPLEDVYKVGHDIVRPFFLYIAFAHVAQLQTVKAVHSDDLCYKDLKPANILWHPSAQAWGLVDFDCSSAPFEKIDMFDGTPMFASSRALDPPFEKIDMFDGTPMFASSRALERGGWKMEDDFEGLLWVLVWCIMPWQSLVSSSKAFKKDSQRYIDCIGDAFLLSPSSRCPTSWTSFARALKRTAELRSPMSLFLTFSHMDNVDVLYFILALCVSNFSSYGYCATRVNEL